MCLLHPFVVLLLYLIQDNLADVSISMIPLYHHIVMHDVILDETRRITITRAENKVGQIQKTCETAASPYPH